MKPTGVRTLALALCLALALPPAVRAEEAPPAETPPGTLTCTQQIAPAYEDAGPVSEGLAAVRRDGKWGYVDTGGQVCVDFSYDLAFPFREGLAVVGRFSAAGEDGEAAQSGPAVCRYGFVDRAGGYTPFLSAGRPYETCIDPGGDPLLFRQGFVLLPGGRLGTAQGRVLDSALVPTGSMGDGLCPGYDPARGGACGYLDEQGATALYWGQAQWSYFGEGRTGALGQTLRSYRYTSAVGPFHQGLAPAWQTTYDAQTGRESSLLGFLDPFGRWALPPAYAGYRADQDGAVFREGLAVVRGPGGLWGAVDRAGQTAVPFQYQALEPCGEGLLAFRQDGACGFLKAGGGVAVPARYDRVSPLEGGMAAVEAAGEQGLVDRYGTTLALPEALAGADLFRRSYDGGTSWLWAERDGQYGLFRLDFAPRLPEAGELDGWALEEVRAAAGAGLVPVPLLCSYRGSITRAEFCALVVQALCSIEGTDRAALVRGRTGKDLYAWTGTYPFRDASDADVIAAYALGIVTGRGGRVFDPAASITRQEAAAYLTRTAALLGMDTRAVPAGYDDGGAVGAWFTQDVDFVTAAGVMGGTGANRFSPLAAYTREQSFVTLSRLLQALENPPEPPPAGEDEPPEEAQPSPAPTASPAPGEEADAPAQTPAPEESPAPEPAGSPQPEE